MHFPTTTTAAACLALCALTGCTFIPRLDLPALPVAGRYPDADKNSSSGAAASWRQVFGDARLARLIEIALANNRDLRVAMLNVEEARAQYRIERSSFFPSLSGSGDFSRQRQQGTTGNTWNTSVGLTSYELDLFGRVRSQNRQALETYFSKQEAQRGAQVTLVSEVATQYYSLLRAEELLAVTRDTLKTVEESYELNKSTFDAGGTNELDLRSAEAQVLSAKSNVIGYERQRAQAENGLVLLIGQPLPARLPEGRSLTDARVSAVPAGLPSQLMTQRPDIMEAEHVLRAANASIGAARAAFFPTLKLTSSGGSSSVELNQLFSKGTAAWSFAPQITVPIFTGGYNRATLDVAKVRTRREVVNYEKAIQTAFREVADALAARRSHALQIHELEALVAAQQKRFELATARYRQGEDTYLNVLSAQQDLYSARQNLIQTRCDLVNARVSLYKAIGGGWR